MIHKYSHIFLGFELGTYRVVDFAYPDLMIIKGQKNDCLKLGTVFDLDGEKWEVLSKQESEGYVFLKGRVAMSKVVVPEGMGDAARKAWERWKTYARPEEQYSNGAVVAVEAALRWLSENPFVPTREKMKEMETEYSKDDSGYNFDQYAAIEWQRRMFLAPEPKVPDEIKDLLDYGSGKNIDEAIIEAFRRGKQVSR